jgi:hypothetical protein
MIPTEVLPDTVTIYEGLTLGTSGSYTGGTTCIGTNVVCLLEPLTAEQVLSTVGELDRVVLRMLFLPTQRCDRDSRIVVQSSASFSAGKTFSVLTEPLLFPVPFSSEPHHKEAILLEVQ